MTEGRDFVPVDPIKWSEMDAATRLRFHEMGNHIVRLEGVLTGLSMRVPSDPAAVPLLQEKVNNLESSHRAIETKVDKIGEKLNSLTIKVVGGTTIATTIVSFAVQVLGR